MFVSSIYTDVEGIKEGHPMSLNVIRLLIIVIGMENASLGAPRDPQFEIVSIKPSPPSAGPRNPLVADPGRVSYTNLSPLSMIQIAYAVPKWKVHGGPPWLESDRYDVIGILPSGSTKSEIPAMMKSMLIDRFRLIVRADTKKAPVYDLVAAKGGVKLKPSAPEMVGADGIPMGGILRGRIVFPKMSLAGLASILSNTTGRPVLDKTNISGQFDLDLKWNPNESEVDVSSDRPSLYTALQEQLGLKLVPTKATVPILVLKHIEKPTGD